MHRKSQKNIVLRILKEKYPQYVPAWEFVGEKYTQAHGWVFLSYKAPARLSDLFNEGKVERRLIKGKSGSKYYEYIYKPTEREKKFLEIKHQAGERKVFYG